MYRPNGGFLEMIVGCMYAGKSEELIRRMKRVHIAKQEAIIFKPKIDNRYGEECICTHDGKKLRAIEVEKASDILRFIDRNKHIQVVGIDEVQFFDKNIVVAINALTESGIRVMCSGLDLDFQGKPFGQVPRLLAHAEIVDKLQAVCVDCGQPATRTQRRINGKPVYEGETVLVGGDESYVATCSECY